MQDVISIFTKFACFSVMVYTTKKIVWDFIIVSIYNYIKMRKGGRYYE